MQLEAAIYAQLMSDTDVTALISTRLYPLTIPQDVALPAAAYQRVSGARWETHTAPAKFANARIQFTCQATSYATAKAVKEEIRKSLEGWEGLMGGAGGVEVDGGFVRAELDGYGMTSSIYTVRLDMEFFYIE